MTYTSARMAPFLLAAAAAAEAPEPLLLSLGRIVIHVSAAWVMVTALLGAISGHMRLLKTCPPVDEAVRQTFAMALGIMGRLPLTGALHVGIGPRGLHIAPSWPFRAPTHWAIPCVPWKELRCTKPQSRPADRGSRWSHFEIPGLGVRFEIAGKAGRAIEAALAAAGGASLA